MGGLLTLNSFVTVFPEIDTTHSSSSTSTNSTNQGKELLFDSQSDHILIYQASPLPLTISVVSSVQSFVSGSETTLAAARPSSPAQSS